MFKKLFGRLFSAKKGGEESSGAVLVATLNDKIMPIYRGIVYEDPIEEYLAEMNIGEIVGSGTFQEETGEVACCDIQIILNSEEIEKTTINNIIKKFEELGAPKGSTLLIEKTGEEISFGIKEGLGIYLDGVNLPPEIYKDCDVNIVLSELQKLTGDARVADRFWAGPAETALYFYGANFEEMKSAIKNFTDSYPLCKNARIVQIA